MWWALATAALAGVTPVDAGDLDAVYAPRRVALLVGVDSYDDPALQRLSFAAKDATDLGAALSDPAYGGYDRVTVVTGEQATSAAEIRRAVREATADLQRDDTFLLYLSGHGTLDLDPIDGTSLYVLPSDGVLDDPRATAIPVRWLEDEVGSVAARRRVLILDTCHNGRDKSGVSQRTASLLRGLKGDPPPPGAAEVSESEARLYAAQYHQAAMEDPNLGNGVYTHFLIAALTDQRGRADLDGDGLVDVVEAHSYARDGTMTHTGGMQTPRAEYRIVGKEEIYLSGDPSDRHDAESALLSAYDALLASARLFVDGVSRGALPGAYAVEPGAHRIEVQTGDGRVLARRQVQVQAGTHYAVEDLVAAHGPRLWAGLGAAAWTGVGGATAPWQGELELGVQPFEPAWALPALLLRASAAPATYEGDLGASASMVGGTVGLAAFLGFSPNPERFAIGPMVGAELPWRAIQGDGAPHATIAPALGARAQLHAPLDDQRALWLRLDSRTLAWTVQGAPTRAWIHGLAVGISTR